MIDGNEGDALTRKGNSSMTTGSSRSPVILNRWGMASSQSRNAGTGDPLKRMSSSANSRSETASVSSRAGK
jgi:hypothetical protein